MIGYYKLDKLLNELGWHQYVAGQDREADNLVDTQVSTLVKYVFFVSN